jgi:hypothetical protein
MNRKQKKELRDLIRFIEAHGGKLGPYHPPGAHHGYGSDRCRYCGHVTPAAPPENATEGLEENR